MNAFRPKLPTPVKILFFHACIILLVVTGKEWQGLFDREPEIRCSACLANQIKPLAPSSIQKATVGINP